ncbi:MAG TPA: carboxypeptidase-like regulatory domain-containing protein [Nitrososphaerales archaeon]
MRNKSQILVIATAITIAVGMSLLFYPWGEPSSEIDVSKSTQISISFLRYEGLVQVEKAKLETLITNDASVRVSWMSINGSITQAYSEQLSREQLEDLTRFLLANDFFQLNEKYTTPDGVAVMDAGIAEITVRIDSLNKTVVISPNITDYLPKNLKNILDELNKLTQETIENGAVTTLSGSIVGRVVDRNGYPISGVIITILNGTAAYPKVLVVSNEEGAFEFQTIPLGSFTVAIQDEKGVVVDQISVLVTSEKPTTTELTYPYSVITDKEFSLIIWKKTGGIRGAQEELIINFNGTVTYSSDVTGIGTLRLTRTDQGDLMTVLSKAELLTAGNRSYTAQLGAADYFNYQLSAYSGSEVTLTGWVDSWASGKNQPSELEYVNQYLQKIIERIQLNATDDDGEKAVKISKGFIVQAPTFKYYGMVETLNVVDARGLMSYPVQYVTTITFDSRNAGYGDRSGRAVATVITPHTAIIKVVNNTVISAILDNAWDELKQKPLQTTPQPSTISGRVSIGPLCPVEPCPDPKPDVYTSRMIILQPEVGAPIQIRLNADGTFEAKVNPGVYTLDISDCTFLGCKRTLPIKVVVDADRGLAIEITIDTGIR